jgi:hypothetical protein
MSLWRLIVREIIHRKVNSALVLLSVVVAVGCLFATLSMLRAHDLSTSAILTKMRQETQQRTDLLKDDYRKIVLTLGFNVFILPAEVSPEQSYQPGLGGHEMPEDYVEQLAQAGVMTIDHLLPSLSVPVQWPEQKLHIIVTGVRGEVAVAGKKRKRPLIQPVEPGEIVLGYNVARQIDKKPGDKVQLLGSEFQVKKSHDARGTQDDNTVWIDLARAQQLLGKEDRITSIQAINCLAPQCHPDATGIPSVSDEIARVLPNTQVVIDMGKARARIDARRRAAEEAQAALQSETDRRARLREQFDSFASVLNPLVLIGAGLWIGLLTLTNVRERRVEVAVLRALGVTTRSLLLTFLGKALLMGLLGGILGYFAGIAIGSLTSYMSPAEFIRPASLILTVALTPMLVAVASWIPAMLAASQDPALILNQE